MFCDLFGRQEYLMQLYGVLHPEDKKTTEEDLTIVTLSSVFLKGIYNDLGFMRGNTLIVLVEEQRGFFCGTRNAAEKSEQNMPEGMFCSDASLWDAPNTAFTMLDA